MHELAVTQSILEIVLKSAMENDAEEVTDINLTIGALSSIIDDSVQFYWDQISQGTIAQNARLHFNRVLATFRCRQCGTEYDLNEELTPCPTCNSINLDIISGEEFQIDNIEIKKKEADKNETTC
jgi:hydrogenase nickel incorporation protein HypA/HybF